MKITEEQKQMRHDYRQSLKEEQNMKEQCQLGKTEDTCELISDKVKDLKKEITLLKDLLETALEGILKR